MKGISNLSFDPELRTEGQSPISNTKLIITVDNGIVASDAVDFANRNGIDVIITDHHVPSKKLPKAVAIVHTTKLCGAGVAYLLSQEIKNSKFPGLAPRSLAKGGRSGTGKIQSAKLFKISNRQEAINTAIKIAQKGDFVLVTGKGHEKSMNFGRGEIPWSEYDSVKEALVARKL